VSWKIYLGTVGWSIPRASQRHFPAGESSLVRYSKVLPAVEINSTFYRPHRATTFERWAQSVPRVFRFSVKLPQAITHDARLVKSGRELDAFLSQVQPLGARLGCLLAQLPPSLDFEPRVARAFFTVLRNRFDGGIALEPRHKTWFEARPGQLMKEFRIARVAADPPRADGALDPGGWDGLAYFRLHGSPRIYYSSYEGKYLAELADRLRDFQRRRVPVWCIFDNTASGAAAANALSLAGKL
jgi:uncharacterized protein YecE (DUF72 family)